MAEGIPGAQNGKTIDESGKQGEATNNSEYGRQLRLKGKNAEQFVYELAKKSFFDDWCYINPQRIDGKELCDLLYLFSSL